MSYLDDAIKQLHESDLALDGRIRRLEAAAGAPDATDAWHEQMKRLEADLASAGEKLAAALHELDVRTQQRDVAYAQIKRDAQELHDVRERHSDTLKREQAKDRFWEKTTDSMAASTDRLAERFGNDNTWDELIALAADRLDELDPA
jgi:chromosome segregation ATPase